MSSEKQLAKHFFDIKSKGWIPTKRYGDQCLGNTFEDLIGKKEDNLSVADFGDIELKTHRTITSSMVSLFSKAPTYPRRVNTYLRETFGVVGEEHDKKILNTTVSGKKENTHRGGFGFKLVVDREKQRIYLQIRNLSTDCITDDEIFWSFKAIENALKKKIKKIAILYGEEKVENGQRFVKFSEMRVITGITLETLVESIEKGELLVDIRIGVYLSGKNVGKTHDHGTAFRIKLDKLLETYKDVEVYK